MPRTLMGVAEAVWPRLQFGLQFTAVRYCPWETGQRRWSSLNRSGRLSPELLMRLGLAE